MGSGIIEVAARGGARVTFVEGSDELAAAGRDRIEASIGKAVDRGKLEPSQADEILARIVGSNTLEALAEVDLVVEAATEDPGAKRSIFAGLGRVTRPEVVLASNTSSIPISSLAEESGRPDKVIGIHFFNPPPVMPLVELIPAETTSEETFELAKAWVEGLGKTTVRSRDEAGFIVNRLLIPYLNDAVALVEDEVATKEDVDQAIQLGLGHPMGPLALADLIGIDTVVHIARVLHEAFGDDRFRPHPVLLQMVADGRLGRKSGSGFYEY
jgi:3-hydroxybutyryl-CoA dehydrogenase